MDEVTAGILIFLCSAVAFLFGHLIPQRLDGQVLLHDQWQCTASHVTKETLPREEECTQYTKKEIGRERN